VRYYSTTELALVLEDEDEEDDADGLRETSYLLVFIKKWQQLYNHLVSYFCLCAYEFGNSQNVHYTDGFTLVIE